MKVVIVDDEFWTRNSIRQLADWDRFGIVQIEEAEDGLSGLKIIDVMKPDIVITDMRMRGIGRSRAAAEAYGRLSVHPQNCH